MKKSAHSEFVKSVAIKVAKNPIITTSYIQEGRVFYLENINHVIYPLVGNDTHWWRKNASRGRLIGRFKELALIQNGNQVIAYNTTTNTTAWSVIFTVEYTSTGDVDNDGEGELFLVNNDTVCILEDDGTVLYNNKVKINGTSYPVFSITASGGLILFVYKNITEEPPIFYPAKATFEQFKSGIAYAKRLYGVAETNGRIIAIKQGFYVIHYVFTTGFELLDTNFNSIVLLQLSDAYSGFATNMQKYWIIPDQDGDGYDDVIIDNGTKSMSLVALSTSPIYSVYGHIADVEVLENNVYAIINHELYWMNTSHKLQLNRTDYYFIDLDAYNTLYALAPGGLIIKNVHDRQNEEFIVVPEAPLKVYSSLNYLCYWTKKIAWTPYGTLKFVGANISKCVCGEHAFGILLENGTLLIYNETHLLKKLNNINDINALDYHKEQKALYLAFPNGTVKMFYPEGTQSRNLGTVSLILAKSNVYIMYYNETHVIIEEFDWTLTPVDRRYVMKVKSPTCFGAYADYDNDGLFEFAVSAYNSTHGEYAILSETLALIHKEETSGLIQVWSFGDGFVIYNGTYGTIYPTNKTFPMSTPISSSHHLIVSAYESYYFTNQSLGKKTSGGIAGIVIAEYPTSAEVMIINKYGIENITLTNIDRKAPEVHILAPKYDEVLNAYVSKPTVSFKLNVSDDIEVDAVRILLNDSEKVSEKISKQQEIVLLSFTADEGYYTIKVIVNDTSGKETILQDYMYVDGTPPVASLVASDLINKTEISISWSASDNLTHVSRIAVMVNGSTRLEQSYSQDSIGGSASIYLGSGEGVYNVTLLAYDLVGNSKKIMKLIRVDLTLPQLTVSEIDNNSALIANLLNVSVEAFDANGIARILVIRNETVIANVSTQSLNVSIPLLDGTNEIVFKAIDNAGNIKKLVYYVYKDVTPPKVEIRNPANGSWLASNQVNVSWISSDDLGLDKFEIYVNETLNETLSPDCRWVIITLNDGVWNITVIAYDKVGNTNSSTIIIYIDTTPPFVEIKTPKDYSFINQTSVIITWNMCDNLLIEKIEIYLDEKKLAELLPPTNQYLISNLPEGEHRVKVVVYDKMNYNSYDEVRIIVDLTKPHVKVETPQSNSYVSGSFTLKWNASDNYGIREFIIYANDEKIMELNGTEAEVSISLKDGVYTIKVVAIDYAGNQDYDQISIIVDSTPPIIKITSPSSLSTIYTADFVIMWNASDNIELNRIQVWLNDSLKAELPPNTSQYTFIGIPDGAYLIKIVAIDKAGNTAYDSIIVVVDAPLAVKILSPPNGGWFNTQVIKLRLEIANTTEVKNIMIFVNGIVQITNTTNTTFNLVLSEGFYNVTAVVEDIANNVATDAVMFHIDLTAPVIKITQPSNKTEINPGNITITYSVSDNFGIKKILIFVNNTLVKETNKTSITIYLEEGKWIIRIIAEDYAGNRGKASIVIIVKQKPREDYGIITATIITVFVGMIIGSLLLIRARKLHRVRR